MCSIVRGSSINGSASIHQSFQMYITLEQLCCSLYVINGGKENTILGHPWLEAVNLIINWKKGTVTIPPTKDQSLALSFAHLAE